MSYAKVSDHGIEKRSSRHRPYMQPLKAVETQVAVLQQALQGQQQQRQDVFERNLVLTELNYYQERLQAIYNKQLQWLECPNTAEQQQSLAASSCAPASLEQSHAAEPWPVQDARWVLFCLETASKEQVQQALSMTAADWTDYQQQHCEILTRLVEIDKRSPEVQRTMPGELLQAGLPAPEFPPAYAASRLSEPAAAPGDGDIPEATSSPAFEAIVHRLRRFATLAYTVLLHGLPCIMEASSKNLHTGQTGHSPPVHWVNVAMRMRFSAQQKLHFKYALENFTRQLQANADQQDATLQQTPSYAFLLASQTIAARESSEEGAAADVRASAGHSSSNIPEQPGLTSFAGSVTDRTSASGLVAAPAPASAPVTASSGPDAHTWRQQSGDASSGPGSKLAAGTAAAGGAAAGAAGPSAAGQGGGSAGSASTPVLPDEHEVQAVVKAVGECAVSHELKHQMGLFYQHVVTLNTFLADSLTLEQLLMLNVASYPFWPLMHLVASAAIQLPDEPETKDATDSYQHDIQVLMLHRRGAMLDAHSQMFGDHSTPGERMVE